MNRAERTKLLIEVGRKQALEMADQIANTYEIVEVQPPREGLVMVKLRESAQQSLFYIGEVLVTETKVKIRNVFGTGIVREMEPELSRALAIIDAAFKGDFPETKQWIPVMEQLKMELELEQQNIKRSIERTKVQFNTMSL
ncbi:phosphonate C-P lyase system protein PhnG [Solibacillus sp. A46]|uniref:Phosphonate C-P lyase system protein PhnG n=1 Tax=Solibacillus faecavium TaxID=2762221 RepID=A0ABR8XYJ7_9BACL|nr:phosphonate C-P lyase system protein PhnG [Solibacillus faecavium]MBD8037031.1 phosphonate C-P lyase system protein PhnG [Solibacillus faecavium]